MQGLEEVVQSATLEPQLRELVRLRAMPVLTMRLAEELPKQDGWPSAHPCRSRPRVAAPADGATRGS